MCIRIHIASRPITAAALCLTRYMFRPVPCSRAKAALAEKTAINPSPTSRMTVVKSTLSKASFLAIQGPHQILEVVTTLVEAPILIEAGAGRRKQDHVPLG